MCPYRNPVVFLTSVLSTECRIFHIQPEEDSEDEEAKEENKDESQNLAEQETIKIDDDKINTQKAEAMEADGTNKEKQQKFCSYLLFYTKEDFIFVFLGYLLKYFYPASKLIRTNYACCIANTALATGLAVMIDQGFDCQPQRTIFQSRFDPRRLVEGLELGSFFKYQLQIDHSTKQR